MCNDLGNDAADKLAKLGANLHAVPAEQCKLWAQEDHFPYAKYIERVAEVDEGNENWFIHASIQAGTSLS